MHLVCALAHPETKRCKAFFAFCSIDVVERVAICGVKVVHSEELHKLPPAAGDAYLKHIASETGTQVVLKGHGSGMVETPEPVHIFVSGGDQKGNSEAVRSASDKPISHPRCTGFDCGSKRLHRSAPEVLLHKAI